MYKVVGITTHGFATFEGIPIMCYRWAGVFMEAESSYVFIYDDKGKMVEARQPQYHNPVMEEFLNTERNRIENEDMEFVHPPI